MLEQCPCFERAPDAITLEPRERDPSFRDQGTLAHRAYEVRMKGGVSVVESSMTSHEVEGIIWAVDYTKCRLTTAYPVELEQRLVLMDDAFNIVTYGTGDCVNGPQIFDLKSGDFHNYWLQMAAYALAQMDRIGLDQLDVTLLYARYKKPIELTITREECKRRIFKVVNAVLDPLKKPKANPYCRWCRKIMTCEAVMHLASGTEHERYQIDEPVELADALKRALILKEWVKRVEDHGKSLAIAGVEIPDFELKSRNGAREIADILKAHGLLQLPSEEFISLCNVSVGAIEDELAKRNSLSKSKAKALVNNLLGEATVRRPPTLRLALAKNQDEPPEE